MCHINEGMIIRKGEHREQGTFFARVYIISEAPFIILNFTC